MADSTLRGVGRNAAGPLEATHKIHAWIGDHPGCTRDEVVKMALERQWVAPGYANRWYAKQLNNHRRNNRRRRPESTATKPAIDSVTPATVDPDKAQRAVVQHLLRMMLKLESIGSDDDGFVILRPLKATQGLTREQIVTNPDDTRADIAERELLRALRPLRDSLGVKYYRVPRDVQVKLQRWVDLKLVQRPT